MSTTTTTDAAATPAVIPVSKRYRSQATEEQIKNVLDWTEKRANSLTSLAELSGYSRTYIYQTLTSLTSGKRIPKFLSVAAILSETIDEIKSGAMSEA